MTDDVRRATCVICEREGSFITFHQWNGVEDELVDSWWSHDNHPEDDHDFQPV